MNAQLLAHFEAFDDDHNNEHTNSIAEAEAKTDSVMKSKMNDDLRSWSTVNDNVDENDDDSTRREEVMPHKGNDNISRAVADHVQNILTILFFALSSLISFIAGNSMTPVHQHTLLLVVVVVVAWVLSIPARSVDSKHNSIVNCVNKNNEPENDKTKNSEAKVSNSGSESHLDECAMNVSRILGLIGSPPLKWTTTTTTGYASVTKRNERRDHQSYCTHAICQFFEAHAQLLLSVDECYYWIKVTSGLHMGLGPLSQAIERAELATLTRQRRQQQQQQQQGRLGHLRLSLQHRIDTGTILSLSSTRKSVASILSDQTSSIVHVYRTFISNTSNHRQHDDDDQCRYSDGLDDSDDFGDFLRAVPDVIDLVWIKAARRHVAKLLSDFASHFLMIMYNENDGGLGTNVEWNSETFLHQLERSTSDAKRAREYMRGSLLLTTTTTTTKTIFAELDSAKGEENQTLLPSAIPLRGSSTRHNHKLLPYLIHHQEKLEGIKAAMGAIYEHYFYRQANDQAANHEDEPEDIDAAVAGRWWDEVKRWSAALQSMEREIDYRFFAPHRDTKSVQNDNHGNNDPIDELDGHKLKDISCNYMFNHDGKNGQSTRNLSVSTRFPSIKMKTQVFKGKGVIEPRPLRYEGTSKNSLPFANGGGDPYVANDWSMDVMTSLVDELQKRSLSLLPAEEDVEEHEIEVEGTDADHRSDRDHTNSETEQPSASQFPSMKENDVAPDPRLVSFFPKGLHGTAFLAELQQAREIQGIMSLDRQAEDPYIFE